MRKGKMPTKTLRKDGHEFVWVRSLNCWQFVCKSPWVRLRANERTVPDGRIVRVYPPTRKTTSWRVDVVGERKEQICSGADAETRALSVAIEFAHS
jgi:hypothetical protein